MVIFIPYALLKPVTAKPFPNVGKEDKVDSHDLVKRSPINPIAAKLYPFAKPFILAYDTVANTKIAVVNPDILGLPKRLLKLPLNIKLSAVSGSKLFLLFG